MNGKIRRIMKRHPFTYSTCRELLEGGVLFGFDSLDECSIAGRILSRNRNLHVKTDPFSWSVKVYTKEDWEKLCVNSRKQTELTEMFYMELRKGKTQDEAKQTQTDFCEAHPDYRKAFEKIYA